MTGPMRLTVIGCAGSFPGPDSGCSAYLVEADGFRLLLDFGTGSLGALQRYAGLHVLDAILLTHLHPDHCFDACSYLVARRYDPSSPFPRLPLYGPRGTGERLAGAHHVLPGVEPTPVDDVYDVHELSPSTFEIGPFRVVTDRVNHPVETYAARVEYDGRTLAYSADTGESPVLVDLARDADLLLCEASYLDGRQNPPNLHLTGRQAGQHATKAEVGRLLLTHLVDSWGDPGRTLAEATAAYDGPVRLVRPGDGYDV